MKIYRKDQFMQLPEGTVFVFHGSETCYAVHQHPLLGLLIPF